MSDHICFVQTLGTPEISFHLNDFTVLFWLLQIAVIALHSKRNCTHCSRIPLNIHLPDGQPAFLLLPWSMLLKRLWSGALRAPQSHGSRGKKANTDRFLGKSALGTHSTYCRGGILIPQPCYTPSGDVGLPHSQSGPCSGSRVLRVIIWHSKYHV